MTPTAPMQYLLNRLRTSCADPALFTDAQLTTFLNDGYQAACERSRCLRAWTQVTATLGVQEYALPADWCGTIGVYQLGERMTAVSPRIAPRGDQGPYYYSYGGVIGLVDIPQTDGGSFILHYARTPTALALDDTPDAQFGPEWYWLLRAYAMWHVYQLGYGAQNISHAMTERSRFEMGVAELERWSRSQNVAEGAAPVRHVVALLEAGVNVGAD